MRPAAQFSSVADMRADCPVNMRYRDCFREWAGLTAERVASIAGFCDVSDPDFDVSREIPM